MVAACTAWADWKHRRATKTACDTPVGHPPPPPPPPPPRLYSDKSPLGEKGGVGALPVCVSAFIRCGREDRCLFPLSFGGLAQEYHVPPKDSTGREMHEVSECMPWVLQAASRPPPRPRPPPPPCQRQTFLETAGFELGLLEEGFSPAFKTGRRGCPSHIRPFRGGGGPALVCL